jgi:drug/metabolite transporter (DMT)-like permease
MDDPASSTRSARLPALAAGFATLYLVWGSTYLGIKFAIETLPPFLMAGCRFLLAGTALYTVVRWFGAPRPTLGQWATATWIGSLLLLLGNGLVTFGQQTVPSGQASLIVATMPLWMVLLDWLFYGARRPGLRVWLGLAVGFAGAVLLIRPTGETDFPTASFSLIGTLALAASPVAWSVGSLESRRRPTMNALQASAMQMLAGGALLVVAGSLLGEWPVLMARPIAARSVAAFFYLVIVGGLIGFTTYAWLLRVASPTAVTTYAYVNPLVAVLLGWLVAGETLDARILVAASLIVGAVVLITLPRPAAVCPPAARPHDNRIPARPPSSPPPDPVLSGRCSAARPAPACPGR